MKNSLAKNTLMLSAGTALSKGIQFILVVFVSRWLSAEAYGTFDVICTYVTLLLPILSLSTGEAVFRFSASKKTGMEQACYITNGFFLIICNFGICAAVLIFMSAIGILSSTLLFPFLLLLATQLLNYYLQAFLRAIKRLMLYAMSNIVFTFTIVLFSTLFVRVFHLGLTGLIYAYIVGYATIDALVIFLAKFQSYVMVKEISGSIVKQLVRYSLPLVPNDISWWILNVSDRQVILIVLGATFNGIYAIANKIPALCSSVFGMFSVSWQQNMVEKIETKDWKEYANQVYNQMTVILLTMCSGILSVTFLFYTYMFDMKYYSGIIYVPILLTAVIFSSYMQFLGGIQIALKKTVENGVTTVIGAVVNLIIDLAMVHYIGLYAAAISTLSANMVCTALRWYRLKKLVRFRIQLKTFCSLMIYMYFILSFYFFKGSVLFEWINMLLAMLIFITLNYRLLFSALRRQL